MALGFVALRRADGCEFVVARAFAKNAASISCPDGFAASLAIGSISRFEQHHAERSDTREPGSARTRVVEHSEIRGVDVSLAVVYCSR